MEDLVTLLIFAGVFIFSLIAGGKKKKRAQGQRPPARPRPQVAVRPSPEPTQSGEPQELVEGLLDLLRGRIPTEMRVEPGPAPPPVEVDDEAVSLEVMVPDREQEHQEFHDKYVATSVPATVTPRPRSRYRLTPKTAREAVVWTAIFTRPKGME